MQGFNYSDFVAQIARGGARDVHLRASSLAILLSAVGYVYGRNRWHVSGDEIADAEYDVVENWLDLAVLDLLTELTGGGSNGALIYANLGYVEEAGQPGGTNVIDEWTQYPLNSVLADEESIVTLTDNQFQIAAGNFIFEVEAGNHNTGATRLGLYNVTQNTPVKIGVNRFSGNVTVRGFDVSNGSDWYEVQYYASAINYGDGLGRYINSGDDEFFLDVNIYYSE